MAARTSPLPLPQSVSQLRIVPSAGTTPRPLTAGERVNVGGAAPARRIEPFDALEQRIDLVVVAAGRKGGQLTLEVRQPRGAFGNRIPLLDAMAEHLNPFLLIEPRSPGANEATPAPQ